MKKMRTLNFKISDFPWLTKNLPNCLYHFSNNLADFLKIMYHSSMPWQIIVDTLDRARTWNFKFSSCQPLLWNWNAKSCPTLYYTPLYNQPCSTLPYCVILTLLLVLAWSINWWNIQQKCGNVLMFLIS